MIELYKLFYDVLEEVFKLMNIIEEWKIVVYQICKFVMYIKDGSKIINLIEFCKFWDIFFKVVINFYI